MGPNASRQTSRFARGREALGEKLKADHSELPLRNAEKRLIRSPPLGARSSFASQWSQGGECQGRGTVRSEG
jgi:hypothetical protein